MVTKSWGKFEGLRLDESSLVGVPPGFNHLDVTQLQDYSDLKMRWWYLEGGIRQLIADRYVMEYALTYQDYSDYRVYLTDNTGSRFGMLLRFNWLFCANILQRVWSSMGPHSLLLRLRSMSVVSTDQAQPGYRLNFSANAPGR
jgi:hypothetical protein